jgi:hypothetical protein
VSAQSSMTESLQDRIEIPSRLQRRQTIYGHRRQIHRMVASVDDNFVGERWWVEKKVASPTEVSERVAMLEAECGDAMASKIQRTIIRGLAASRT